MALLEPPQELLRLLRESLPEDLSGKPDDIAAEDGQEEILAYVAFLAAGLTEAHQYDASIWEEALQPYLSSLLSDNKEIVEKFRVAAEQTYVLEDDSSLFGDEDDDAEELCDLRFKYVTDFLQYLALHGKMQELSREMLIIFLCFVLFCCVFFFTAWLMGGRFCYTAHACDY